MKTVLPNAMMICISCFHFSAQSSELSRVADSMLKGEWKLLNTENIQPVLSTKNGSNLTIFGYTLELKWDPVSRQLLYVGGDAIEAEKDPKRFVTYHESTNTWEKSPQPAYLSTVRGHGNDDMAIDIARGIFYTRKSESSRTIMAYDIANETWNALPDNTLAISASGGSTCCGGIEYFPELNGLVWINGASTSNDGKGGVFIFRNGASSWERLADGLFIGEYRNFLEYSPVHKVALFGGGNGLCRSLYKLDASGQITKLKDAPLCLGIQYDSVPTVDPVSGDFLVFSNNNVSYTYNVQTDTWERIGTSSPLFSHSDIASFTVATPIREYGVVLFVARDSSDAYTHKVYLYKHSPSSGLPPRDSIPPSSPSVLETQ